MAIAPKRGNNRASPSPNGAELALYAMRLLRGQGDSLNGVHVLQAVGVALENRLVLRGASVVSLCDRSERITREDGVERFMYPQTGAKPRKFFRRALQVAFTTITHVMVAQHYP